MPAVASAAERSLPWIGFLGDLLQQPLTAMPHEQIIRQLQDTFDVTAASYNWLEASGRWGIEVRPTTTLDPIAEELLAFTRGEVAGRHPLITWHLTVGGPLPFSNERVPRTVVSDRDRSAHIEANRRIGCEHQVAINVRLGCNLYHSYVISRTGPDFSDEDLAVARQIQRLVIGLDRQIALTRQLTASDHERGVEAGLTTRELCVLSLVAHGFSSQQIARKLRCSPRTVHKHLEHVYRKLGVRDRINALRIAQQWNLMAAPRRPTGQPTWGVATES